MYSEGWNSSGLWIGLEVSRSLRSSLLSGVAYSSNSVTVTLPLTAFAACKVIARAANLPAGSFLFHHTGDSLHVLMLTRVIGLLCSGYKAGFVVV